VIEWHLLDRDRRLIEVLRVDPRMALSFAHQYDAVWVFGVSDETGRIVDVLMPDIADQEPTIREMMQGLGYEIEDDAGASASFGKLMRG
jgi:hypothetical protein